MDETYRVVTSLAFGEQTSNATDEETALAGEI
jgi:hypothetical protein